MLTTWGQNQEKYHNRLTLGSTPITIPADSSPSAAPTTAASPRKRPNNEDRCSRTAEAFSCVGVTLFERTPPAGRSNFSPLLEGFLLSIEASGPLEASTGRPATSKGCGDGYPGGGGAAFQEDDDDVVRNHSNLGVFGICVFDEIAEIKCRWRDAHIHRRGAGRGREGIIISHAELLDTDLTCQTMPGGGAIRWVYWTSQGRQKGRIVCTPSTARDFHLLAHA